MILNIFHVLIIDPYILSGEISLPVICQFLNWIVFLLLSLESSLCIQDKSLLDVWYANIFLVCSSPLF